MQLRPYQTEIIRKTGSALTRNKRVIMCAPTGSGKTVIFSKIIRRHLERDMFNRVLVLTHRTELFSQTLEAVVRAGTSVTELKAGMKTDRIHSECRCLIAMVETLKRRKLQDFGKFTLIIVDEAHRADFFPILENYPEAYIVGATATPISASKKNPLKGFYQDIIESVSITSLIEQGYLSKPNHYKAVFDGSSLQKRAGEYTSESQFELMSNKVQYENVVQLWKSHAGDKKTIVFNINKQHTNEVNEMFLSQNISSTSLLSGDENRDRKIELFRSGEIQVLNNCEIATTGFDIPDIECVVINRATASLPLWLQMVGRGSRTTVNKKQFTILDFGGNIDRHGMWHIERDWKSIFWNPKKAGENPAPHKECPECGALVFSSLMLCEYCGYKFPSAEQIEAEKVKGYLEKVGETDIEGSSIDELTIQQLHHLELAGKYKPSFIARVARTRGELSQYAQLKGYSPGWIRHQMGMDTGYKNYKVKF